MSDKSYCELVCLLATAVVWLQFPAEAGFFFLTRMAVGHYNFMQSIPDNFRNFIGIDWEVKVTRQGVDQPTS